MVCRTGVGVVVAGSTLADGEPRARAGGVEFGDYFSHGLGGLREGRCTQVHPPRGGLKAGRSCGEKVDALALGIVHAYCGVFKVGRV